MALQIPQTFRLATLLVGLSLIVGVVAGYGIRAVQPTTNPQCSENSQVRVKALPLPDERELELIDLDFTIDGLEAGQDNDLIATTQELANSLVHGDLLLRSGNAAMALRVYRQNQKGTSVPPTIDVSYRIALCSETLGDHPEALAGYQAVVGMDMGGLLREYALLGQARVLHKQGDASMASAVLQRWILSRETCHRISPQISGDALYLLSHITAADVLARPESRLWEPNAVCFPRSPFDPGRYLPSLPSIEQLTNHDQPTGIRIAHQLSESSPDTIALSGSLSRATVGRLLDDLAQQAGWPLEWSAQTEALLRSVTVSVDFEEQTANLILDWLLTPHGVVWVYRSGVLRILTEQELDIEDAQAFRWQRAERALLAALFAGPEHPEAPAAYLLLGNLSYQRGQFRMARRHYEHILQSFARSFLQAETWFNLAKVELVEQNLQQAAVALQGAMDAGRGQPLESAALLVAGQTQLELGQSHDATRPLMRAATLAADEEVRALSLLTLASAHLLDGHPERANLALMEDRSILLAEPYRDRAAFLASLARFRAATTPSRRDRDGRALIAAISHLPIDGDVGLAQTLLMAEACTEVGLRHLAVTLAERRVGGSLESRIHQRLVLLLTELLVQNGEDERAESLLTEVVNQSPLDESADALLRLTELYARQHRIEQLEVSCRRLLSDQVPPQFRARSLQLLGRAYSDRGDRQRAVLCYSGILPP